MRHFLLPSAIGALARGMVAATTEAQLIASPSGALLGAPGLLGTPSLTVDVAAVAAGADQHLSAAASAQKKSPSCMCFFGFVTQTWTKIAMGGILPRHTCSARCGARRRFDSQGWDRRRACPQRGQGFSAPTPAVGVDASRTSWTSRARCDRGLVHSSDVIGSIGALAARQQSLRSKAPASRTSRRE